MTALNANDFTDHSMNLETPESSSSGLRSDAGMAWAKHAARFAAETHEIASMPYGATGQARKQLYRLLRALRTAIED